MPSFKELLDALPQELYDKIYDLTFSKASNVVYINGKSRVPNEARVSRATRKTFQESYYGSDTIFYASNELLAKWMHSLDEIDVTFSSEIRVTGMPFFPGKDSLHVMFKKLLLAPLRQPSPEFTLDRLFGHPFSPAKAFLKFEVRLEAEGLERRLWLSAEEVIDYANMP